jgi:hypothetical protein
MAQRPNAIGLHVCEQVIIDEGTRYVTLVNSFSRRFVQHDPPEPLAFVVFARLTEGQGQIPLELVITRLDTLDEIFQQQTIGAFADPLRVIRFILRFQAYSFPQVGTYDVVLLADGEPIARQRIQLLLGGTGE